MILNSPSPDITELKDIVRDILENDRRATEVIRRLRSLPKKAPFELKEFDLNDLVWETAEIVSALAIARKFELVSVLTPDALSILGDRIQLQQVSLKLVNGIDAMWRTDTPRLPWQDGDQPSLYLMLCLLHPRRRGRGSRRGSPQTPGAWERDAGSTATGSEGARNGRCSRRAQ